MSEDLLTEKSAGMCCANCGKAEIDDVKLKDCDRAAEVRDELLFRQPESNNRGDCPICFLPMPIDANVSAFTECCSKFICKGCALANQMREFSERHKHRCPFCRLAPSTGKEGNKILMKRAEANDPVALSHIGSMKLEDEDYGSAFEYWTSAATLGYAEAHYNLSLMYARGQSVDRDEKMQIYHLEEAAIAGHPLARYSLGLYEAQNERHNRAVKHWIIAANLGDDESLQMLKEGYKAGHVNKDDLAAALRAHQAAVDAMKSPQREEAEKLEVLL